MNPLTIGSRRELFVDLYLIDRLANACLKLHEPVSGGVAIKLDRPWEGPANGPLAVFQDGDCYRLYYRSMTLAPGDDTGVLCVATSTDGGVWTKPNLGRVARAGCRDTNIVADEAGNPFMAVPWLDIRPGVSDRERIKAISSEPVGGGERTRRLPNRKVRSGWSFAVPRTGSPSTNSARSRISNAA